MKRLLVPLGLAVVAALAPAGCGSEAGSGVEPNGESAVAPGAEAEIDGATVRVVDTMTASRIVLDGGSEYEPDGTFLLVRLAVERAGAQTAQVSDREVVLLGGDGETYEVDAGGTMAIVRGNRQTSQYNPAKPNGLYGPVDVLPGRTADLTAVFDIPDAAAPGARLRLGPAESARVFELEPDGSVNPALSDLGVRLVE